MSSPADKKGFNQLPPEMMARAVEAISHEGPATGNFVVLATQPEAILKNQEAIEVLAAWLEGDVYQARQRLAAKAPRIIKKFPSRHDAEEVVEQLRDAGVRSFPLPVDSFNIRKFEEQRALYADPQSGDLIFETALGVRRHVHPKQLLCMVTGTVAEQQRRESAIKGTFKDGPAKSELESATSEVYLDIHLLAEPLGIRIRQDGFNWSAIFGSPKGGEKFSSLEAFHSLLRKLRRRFPALSVHNNFATAAGFSAGGNDKVRINTHNEFNPDHGLLPGGRPLKKVDLYQTSSAAAFDEYSKLCAFESLAYRR